MTVVMDLQRNRKKRNGGMESERMKDTEKLEEKYREKSGKKLDEIFE